MDNTATTLDTVEIYLQIFQQLKPLSEIEEETGVPRENP